MWAEVADFQSLFPSFGAAYAPLLFVFELCALGTFPALGQKRGGRLESEQKPHNLSRLGNQQVLLLLEGVT